MSVMPCPECRDGKHTNCVEWALDDRDQEVPCPCQKRGHIPPTVTTSTTPPANAREGDIWVEPGPAIEFRL